MLFVSPFPSTAFLMGPPSSPSPMVGHAVEVSARYYVTLNFCESLIMRIGDFLCLAGTKRLFFLAGN